MTTDGLSAHNGTTANPKSPRHRATSGSASKSSVASDEAQP